jgi:hypothetical protein
MGLVFPALIMMGGSLNQAMAQEQAAGAHLMNAEKVLAEDDKVRVAEDDYKPGAESENKARPYRVVRALTGGTLQRIFPDGKKVTVQWKTGEVRILPASEPYIVRNIGSTEVRLYVVNLK